MGWGLFNLSLMEASDFSLKTQNLILPVFDHATNALKQEWEKYEEVFQKQIAQAYERDESEGGMMSQEEIGRKTYIGNDYKALGYWHWIG